MGDKRTPPWGVYDIFDTQDGRVFVAVVSDANWQTFCRDLLAAFPTLKKSRPRIPGVPGERLHVYCGIGLPPLPEMPLDPTEMFPEAFPSD